MILLHFIPILILFRFHVLCIFLHLFLCHSFSEFNNSIENTTWQIVSLSLVEVFTVSAPDSLILFSILLHHPKIVSVQDFFQIDALNNLCRNEYYHLMSHCGRIEESSRPKQKGQAFQFWRFPKDF
jgi:hypothetical protein